MPIPLILTNDNLYIAYQHLPTLAPLEPTPLSDASVQTVVRRWRGNEVIAAGIGDDVSDWLERKGVTVHRLDPPSWGSLSDFREDALDMLDAIRWVGRQPTTWATIKGHARADGYKPGTARLRIDAAVADGLLQRSIIHRVTYYNRP